MLQKILIVCAAAFFLTIAITSVAKANGGPHGDYTTTTDACAGCHRAHTAPGAYLLTSATEQDLCMSCHGSGATGANTNVADGLFAANIASTRNSNSTTGILNSTVNAPLIAGGFIYYKGQAVTSKHNVDENITGAWGYTGTYTSSTLMGRGVLGTIASPLECSSCHNPHGSTNYRLMNTSANGITVTVTQVDEGAAKNYTKEHWGPDMSYACEGCHKAYHDLTARSYMTPSMVATGGYAHSTQQFSTKSAAKRQQLDSIGWSTGDGITVSLPMADKYFITDTLYTTANANIGLVCETCHLVHGTSSQMTGFANGGPTGTGVVPGSTTSSDSALLRADNRGVCEACHQK